MSFEIILLVLVIAGICISLVYCAITGISPVSSSRLSRKTMVAEVPADTEGVICELGAGWGALAFPLARKCKKATVIAYELSPVPWLFMWIIKTVFMVDNLVILRRNFLKKNLADADIIVCYLHPQAMKKLASKLVEELSPTATVICNTFELPGWQPSIIEKLEDLMCPEVFIYRPQPPSG
jgi:precorrin-6B methylase 2